MTSAMTSMESETPQLPCKVFFDANALWGSLTTDILLNLGELGLPRWSRQVFDEVERTVLAKRPNARVHARLGAMGRAFPDAMVSGFEYLEPSMPAEAGDRHVLAAAVHCGAQVLVTENLRHFHPEWSQLPILVMDIGDYTRALLTRRPHDVVGAMGVMVAGHRHQPTTLAELVSSASRNPQLSEFARDLNAALPAPSRFEPADLGRGMLPLRQRGFWPASVEAGEGWSVR